MAHVNSTAFHGSGDHANQPLSINADQIKKVSAYTLVQDRKLSYRFFPHFHPYVGKLIARLLEKSFSGLQSADTEYELRVSP